MGSASKTNRTEARTISTIDQKTGLITDSTENITPGSVENEDANREQLPDNSRLDGSEELALPEDIEDEDEMLFRVGKSYLTDEDDEPHYHVGADKNSTKSNRTETVPADNYTENRKYSQSSYYTQTANYNQDRKNSSRDGMTQTSGTASRRNIYSESWKASRTYTKHMWRFYFAKQNITIDQMSAASRNAWIACNTAHQKLSPAEQDIARLYFSAEHGSEKDAVTTYSVNKNEPEWSVYKVVNKALKLAAIERGIADE